MLLTIENILVTTAVSAPSGGIWSLVSGTGPLVKLVLLVLIGLSVYTWAIIVFKLIFYRKAEREEEEFRDLFWGSKNLADIFVRSRSFKFSMTADIFRSGYRELKHLKKKTIDDDLPADEETFVSGVGIESIKRTLTKERDLQQARVEKYLNFLATTASAAPFIGLFGTVWGIMDAFHEIGLMGSANLAVVAPGISEALIATATGLAAAIPAVMAYNYFLSRARGFGAEMDSFIADFLNICDRHFL
jgi:biopolymer transport protein TolQ